MSDEFNIFKNLDALRNTNLLDKLKSLQTAKNSNDLLSEDDDLMNDDEFESILNNNVTKSPSKRIKKNGLFSSTAATSASASVSDKVSQKTTQKSQRRSSDTNSTSTISTTGYLSPTLELNEDVSDSTSKKTTKKKSPPKRKKTYVSRKDFDYEPPGTVSSKVTRSTRQSGRLSTKATPDPPISTTPTLENHEEFLNMAHTGTTMQAFEALRKMAEKNARAAREAERRASPNLNTVLAPIAMVEKNVQAAAGAEKTAVENSNLNIDAGSGKRKGRGRGRGRKSVDDTVPNNDNISNTITANAVEPEAQSDLLSLMTGSSTSIMERFLQQARGRGRRGRSQTTRTRRNYVAEVAARSAQVDFIDLVSSPLPRVEGTIALDSDGEEVVPFTLQTKKNPSLDISLEDDNPELSVKINWKGKPEAFKLRKYQKFSVIFNKLAEREGTNIQDMVFNLNERIVTGDDTPDSIDYKIYQFINGRVLSASFNSPIAAVGGGGAPKKQRNANQISIKIQSDKWKRPLQMDIQKTDKFRILYIKCSEELNIGIDEIKLSFDGDLLELNDTPSDLDLEGGEVIDLRLKK